MTFPTPPARPDWQAWREWLDALPHHVTAVTEAFGERLVLWDGHRAMAVTRHQGLAAALAFGMVDGLVITPGGRRWRRATWHDGQWGLDYAALEREWWHPADDDDDPFEEPPDVIDGGPVDWDDMHGL